VSETLDVILDLDHQKLQDSFWEILVTTDSWKRLGIREDEFDQEIRQIVIQKIQSSE
jgi:hypothetical protein